MEVLELLWEKLLLELLYGATGFVGKPSQVVCHAHGLERSEDYQDKQPHGQEFLDA